MKGPSILNYLRRPLKTWSRRANTVASTNGSLAVWYHWKPPTKGHQTRASAELHVNLWRLRIRKNSNQEETFLDIGILLSDASSVAEFYLYLPFQIDKAEEICDLGHLLVDRTTLLAVFNEPYSSGEADKVGTFPIIGTDGKEVLTCHTLSPGVDFTVTPRTYPSQPGTVVQFGAHLCGRLTGNTGHYVRFRIMLDGDKDAAFSRLERQRDRLLLSAKPRDEVVEFRLNEHRSLPQAITDEMADVGTYDSFRISAIRHFLIRESDSAFQMAHSDFHKVRLLENRLWVDYLQGTRVASLPHDSFIYNWRKIAEENEDIGDYHALAKFRRLITGWPTIVGYIFIVLAIGIGGNLIANAIWDRLPSLKAAPAPVED